MRLYLSSYQLGRHPDRLAAMVAGDRSGWVIMNALDGYDEDRRRTDTSNQVDALATHDLSAHDLDLRTVTPHDVVERFGEPDFVWVRGGNVFTLRMALARSGLDQLITTGLAADRFVYAGFSAGSCVLAPRLDGLELCDPAEDCLQTYGEVRFDGLGILDRPVVPHLDSPDHPETDLVRSVAAHYDAIGQAYWPLRDGDVLVVEGERREILHRT